MQHLGYAVDSIYYRMNKERLERDVRYEFDRDLILL